jgi:hypothetical protein
MLSTLPSYSEAEVSERRERVGRGLLQSSRHVRAHDFRAISADDLATLFALYDEHFFTGGLGRLVNQRGNGALTFRLAPRARRSGGSTIRISRPHPQLGRAVPVHSYQITLSSSLLFMSFNDASRPVVVCGHGCASRLDATLRIFEHELIHLSELLLTGRSSCKGTPFHEAARRVFAHRGWTHGLVLPEERALLDHGVRVGDRVRFSFRGEELLGRVNRIHRRATVLVERADGQRYTDGKRYARFYVPLSALERADDGRPAK